MAEASGDETGEGVIRVLVVEDNRADYVLARELLDEVAEGRFETHWAPTPDEGLSCLCAGDYDVCLLDYNLGARSGLEILREANQSGCAIPTILLTGIDTPDLDEKALHARAADYLVKTGLTGRELVRTISYVLERSRAERSLLQSQQFLQSTLDALAQHVAVLDETGTIVAVNQAWERYAVANGCIGGECSVGVNYLHVCEAASGPEAEEAHAVGRGIRSLLSGASSEFYQEYLCPEVQNDRWFALRVTRFAWSGPVHVVVAHEDVTQRYQSEAARRASEARFRAAAEGSLDCFYILESVRTPEDEIDDFRFVYCNTRGARLFGLSLEQVIGHGLCELVPANRTDGFLDLCRDVVASGRAVEMSCPIPAPEVHADWMHFQVVPLEDGIALMAKDITEERNALQALQKREQQLSEAQEIGRVGSWEWDMRHDTRTWSQEQYRIFGLDPDEGSISFEQVVELTVPEDRHIFSRTVEQAMRDRKPFQIQHRIVRPDGAERVLMVRGELIFDENDQPARLVGMTHDVTEQVQSERALRKAEEKYRSIFENAIEGIFQAAPDGRYLSVNPALARIYGYDSPDELTSTLTDIMQQLFVEPQRAVEIRNMVDAAGMVNNAEAQVYRKDGSVIWISISVRAIYNEAGELWFYEGSVEDITREKEVAHQLHREAFYDRLTGLPNRALFINRLGHVLDITRRREDYCFAVLFMDFDGFKHVNDSLGHVLGDELLVELGRRLSGTLRPGDTVARLGGDEFTILLEDIKDADAAVQVAERVHQEVSRPLHLGGHELFPSVSTGIAFGAMSYQMPEDVLRDADTAMYRAKSRGRGTYQVFDPSMHAQAMRRLSLEAELRRAIDNGEIVPFYQPIVSLSNGQLIGFEALVRWRHATRGLVSPVEFIPIAEETGLIVALDEHVRFVACRQLREWQDRWPHAQDWTMSVNVSRKSFSVTDLPTTIQQVLDDTTLSVKSLKVEITETAIVDNVAAAESSLRRLRDMGVSLSMDDFGTGYSSLSYLHRFPLDTLKIDRSFISRMSDGESLEIVRAIIALAHALDLKVTAEGVETAEQAVLLQSLGCECGQGYYFARPVSAEDAVALLAPDHQWQW